MEPAKGRAPARQYPAMTTREVERLIAAGRTIIILDQHVLRVDAWMKYHPGGDKAIQHMVGRDATDEVNASVHPLFPSPACRAALARSD
jgi:sphingolipid 8-(E)-desaturase